MRRETKQRQQQRAAEKQKEREKKRKEETNHHVVALAAELQQLFREVEVGPRVLQRDDLDPRFDEAQRPGLQQNVDDGAHEPEAALDPSDLFGVFGAAARVEVDDPSRGVYIAHSAHQGPQVPVAHALVHSRGRVGRAARKSGRRERRERRRSLALAEIAIVGSAGDARVFHRGHSPRAHGRVADLGAERDLKLPIGEPVVEVRERDAPACADKVSFPAAATAAAAFVAACFLEAHPPQRLRLQHRAPVEPGARVVERDDLPGAVAVPDCQQRRRVAPAVVSDDPLDLFDASRLDEHDAVAAAAVCCARRRRDDCGSEGPVLEGPLLEPVSVGRGGSCRKAGRRRGGRRRAVGRGGKERQSEQEEEGGERGCDGGGRGARGASSAAGRLPALAASAPRSHLLFFFEWKARGPQEAAP